MHRDPWVGSSLGSYLIESRIARGGMSYVYLAKDQRLGRRVALKILDYELSEDPRFRHRFVKESETAAQLEHPNIIPIYEAGQAEDVLYIAMRYVRGGDLGTLLRKENHLSSGRALSLLAQAAQGLDAAHSQGLVHRDVKPANILIDYASGFEHVYLSDFGVTKRVGSSTGVTQTGQFVGTVDYMAPEQIEGEELDGRADVYSLGCVLFECLTGHAPFEYDHPAAILDAHRHKPPPSVRAFLPDAPEALDKVLAKGMAKNRIERYATCGDLVAAARGALGLPPAPEPTVGEPATSPTVVQAPAKPAPTVIDGAGGGDAGTIPREQTTETPAHAAATEVPASPASPAPPTVVPGSTPPPPVVPAARAAPAEVPRPEPRKRRRRRWPLVAAAAIVVVVGGGVGAFVLLRGGHATERRIFELSPRYDSLGGVAWSPDGTRIAFTLQPSGKARDVYLMNADGTGEVVNLTNEASSTISDSDPAWSFDSTKIAFSSDRDNGRDLWVIAADGGSPPQRLTMDNTPDFRPSWSPNGKLVIYTKQQNGEDRLRLLDLDDGTKTPLGPGSGLAGDSASWDPDGALIAFVAPGPGTSEPDIYLVTATGTDVTDLTEGPGADESPAWSPNGKQIAFQSNRDGNEEIYVLDVATRQVTRVTVSDAVDTSPTWSEDGGRLAFIRRQGGEKSVFIACLGRSACTPTPASPSG